MFVSTLRIKIDKFDLKYKKSVVLHAFFVLH